MTSNAPGARPKGRCPGYATLLVRVTPRAPRSAVAGMRAGALLIRLSAPPVEGAANEALTRFLAELLGVPRRDVAVVSGLKSRDKRVAIAGLSADQLAAKLSAILHA
ncbi:MAG TPA: DUF167 domain-containing protein [Vicinamibacterales bacterium]|nr:DUF167 domain-containing protein [Vicinamibacterales bacterium]